MMAPYAIAHMKIGLKLAETGYRFATEERARIYLTNTLEPWVKQLQLIGFDALAHEAEAVNEIKRHKRFTVVIGNPPYAGNSANASRDGEGNMTFIGRLIQDYKTYNGESLEERQIKWLQDDYVKFIRIAQQILRTTGTGVLGYITNHSYLDNPTFRGMRWSLCGDFLQLSLYDLHGNQKKKERCPDGSEDQNVFDILQGVSLLIAVRGRGTKPVAAMLLHADLWGMRGRKYQKLSQNSVSSTRWSRLSPAHPFLIFVPQNISLRAEYDVAWKITDVVIENNVGFVTARDSFAIAFDDDELRERFTKFRSAGMTDAQAIEEFGLKDTTSWSLHQARQAVRADRKWEQHFIPCTYRPFDNRRIYYSRDVLERPVYQIHRHMLAGANLAIAVGRAGQVIDQGTWNIVCATRFITEFNLFRRGGNNLLPLYLYEDFTTQQKCLGMDDTRRINLSAKFLHALSERLNLKADRQIGLPKGLTPEEIFDYIYAVFHSPGYRTRYAEFLKIDFPRLPLTGNLELFRELARLGGELVALHLLESPKLATVAAVYDRRVHAWRFEGSGSPKEKTSDGHRPPLQLEFIGPAAPVVTKPGWTDGTVWLDSGGKKAATTSGTCGFRGVPEAVWNFHIGGYQVCEKWLKDRKGRTLTKDDIAHYHKVVIALAETIRLMAAIDQVIETHGGWPGAFSNKPKP